MRRNLAKRIVPGNLIKWEAIYDTPFWRAQGLSGQVVSDVGPANTTFDNSPPDGTPGVVFGFIGGTRPPGVQLSVAARRKAVLDNFVDLLRPRGRAARRATSRWTGRRRPGPAAAPSGTWARTSCAATARP